MNGDDNKPSQYSQAIFWIEVEKIRPNPNQPRKDFDETALASLSDSIRQYGVLQPLLVSRREVAKEEGGIAVFYELIAGERRLRASKMAGVREVPVIIRDVEEGDKVKLELAIIENLQREDLNPIERAEAFKRLVDEFNLTHKDVAKKVGKSREYVSNTLRILALPEEIVRAVREGKITEGHTRPILMLADRREDQWRLFQDILEKRITVRDAEAISRRVAVERIRRPETIFDHDTFKLEEKLSEKLGTRVRIEKKEVGGKISIEFFSPEDLNKIVEVFIEETLAQGEQDVSTGAAAQEEDLYSIKDFSI